MSITATELKMNLGKYLQLAESEDIFITKNGKKAYLIEKNMPAEQLRDILKQATEERSTGTQINVSVMKKNKKFQKEQLAAEGYTEFVEFFRDRM